MIFEDRGAEREKFDSIRNFEQLKPTGRLHFLWQVNFTIKMPGVRVHSGTDRFLPDNLANHHVLLGDMFGVFVLSPTCGLTDASTMLQGDIIARQEV